MNLYQNTTWTTREGVQLPISQMSTSHAANSYRMLQRQARYLAMTEVLTMASSTVSDSARLSLDTLQVKISDRPMEWLCSTPLMKALAVQGGLAKQSDFEKVDLDQSQGHLAGIYGLSVQERAKARKVLNRAENQARKLGFASLQDLSEQLIEWDRLEAEAEYERELAEIAFGQ